jgi:uncharacterized protein YjbI with pentapeptide repeats
MANQEQLAILKRGVVVWNQWRQEHSFFEPDLDGADLSGADLSEANLFLAHLSEANLSDADLSDADLHGARLSDADLSRANLSRAHLSGAGLGDASLEGADLSDASLEGADLSDSTLYQAYINRAHLSGAHLVGAYLNEADLSGADLSGADLYQAHLYEATLSGANLSRADLSGADLNRAQLEGADLSGADLSRADLSGAQLEGADLSGADLSRAVLVETNLTGATLTQCSVYGISVWNVQLEGSIQDGLAITPTGEPTIKVDSLEVAQFIYLILNYRKLRDVFNAVTERGVLLLGRFGGGGLDVLQAIAAWLREENYLPIIFDFERPQDRNYTETVKTLVGLARFVIADLSGPSVPQELYATVPHFKIPFVPIIEASRKAYSMAVDILEYPWVVMPPVTFATIEELREQMSTRVIAPAEEKHKDRQKKLDELFKEA